MIVLEKIGISILPRNEAILPEVSGWLFSYTMLRAGLIHDRLKIEFWPSKMRGRLSLAALTIILRIGVGHKIQITISLALNVAALTCRVMLLPFRVAALLSLTQIFIIRLGVLGVGNRSII